MSYQSELMMHVIFKTYYGHEFEQSPGDGEGQGSLAMLQSMGSQTVRHDQAAEQQQHWGSP